MPAAAVLRMCSARICSAILCRPGCIRFLGQWVAGLGFPNDKAQHIFIGYSAMILAGMGAWALVRSRLPKARSQGWFWLVSTGLFWLLTLGPTVRVMGQDTGIPGPFALVSLLPFFSGNRYPSRYAIMLMLGVAVLAAVGMAALLRRRPFTRSPFSRSSLICSLLFLAEHLSVPIAHQRLAGAAHLSADRRGAGRFRRLGTAHGLAKWGQGAGQVGSGDHDAAVGPGRAWQAALGGQHQPQPRLQVRLFHQRPA